MLNDLLIGRIPPSVKVSLYNPTLPNWTNLQNLWSNLDFPSIKFETFEHPLFGVSWHIVEQFSNTKFEMSRSQVTFQRNTISDPYGLLGLTLINLKDPRVILTEGVSDYFTAKLHCPNLNVLGVTTLSGSHVAKQILLSLFDTFILCSDNDSNASRNTGILNTLNFKTFLTSYHKSVKIFFPQAPYKDITDNFMSNLKFISY